MIDLSRSGRAIEETNKAKGSEVLLETALVEKPPEAEHHQPQPALETTGTTSGLEGYPHQVAHELTTENPASLSTDADLNPPTTMQQLLDKENFQQPKRGDIRKGVILSIQPDEVIVDIGCKQEGVVQASELQRLEPELRDSLQVGREIPVYILRTREPEGHVLVSLHRAWLERDWLRAQELLEKDGYWEGEVIEYNKGGLVVPFGKIRGFIPASQITGFPRRLNPSERTQRLSAMVGERLPLKVIEVNRRRQRLILSERAGRQAWQKETQTRLLNELHEGEIRQGVVSNISNFGVFVNLGGIEGLVHVSEMSWHRLRHPREMVRVGDEVKVYVLNVDRERGRIGLSFKRLHPDPWLLADEKYVTGQLVEGRVTKVADFGVFLRLDDGIEGLIHLSELAEPTPDRPSEVVHEGDLLLARVIRIESWRRRMGLSLKRVLDSERVEWAARTQK